MKQNYQLCTILSSDFIAIIVSVILNMINFQSVVRGPQGGRKGNSVASRVRDRTKTFTQSCKSFNCIYFLISLNLKYKLSF